MIADRRSERLFNWLKTNVARADSLFPLFSGAAPTTVPERLSKSHGLRCLIATSEVAAINPVAQDVILRRMVYAQDNILRYRRWPMCSAVTPPVKSSNATFAKLSARIISASRA